MDIGVKIHAIVSHKDESSRIKVIRAYEIDDWGDLDYFWKDMGISTGVIDANPDKDEAFDFQKKFSDSTWLAYFSQHLENTTEQSKPDFSSNIVHIHRTLLMMMVSDLVFSKNLVLPIDIRRVKDFYEHMCSPIKAQKQDVKGNWVTFYPKTKNPDHYFFATLYDVVAHTLEIGPGVVRKVNLLYR